MGHKRGGAVNDQDLNIVPLCGTRFRLLKHHKEHGGMATITIFRKLDPHHPDQGIMHLHAATPPRPFHHDNFSELSRLHVRFSEA
jgi:hypothetical protein